MVVNNDPSAINLQSDNGNTPLHLAAFWGHNEVVKLLLDAGARTDIVNKKNRTALDLAAQYAHENAAKLLADAMDVETPELKSNRRKTREMDFVSNPPKPEDFKEKKKASSPKQE